ncbi:type II toxin-antitoxin system RelB/DinJ family antitoxin [Scatolibacter rhodanostii]|uniref:type II toxin-antitoxin system RelB/DinJ family antitoxin n=1 Tax=Scatolibacter rhodanostii TaxID=2014781 RepID=UPI000C07BB37|nr:type II toxin-antitoxin system RelB/DinJ family antitoxin [Scatolibacter rhodanostii]
MSQSMVNFRMDAELKKQMEQACKDMGLNMTATFTIFATKVSREKRIPFEISADFFYSERNMNHLQNVITDIESGRASLSEHELIEECYCGKNVVQSLPKNHYED